MPGKGSHRVSSNGWSPRQIITLVLALCLLTVLLPIGARAAGSLMTIVDSTTSNQARVQNGALRVDGLPVGATRWWNTVRNTNQAEVTIYTPASGKKNLMIGSITYADQSGRTGQVGVFFESPCGGTGVVIEDMYLNGVEKQHLDFPSPLPIVRPDTNWCLKTYAVEDTVITVVGYYY
jgi:hypothetical protein